MSNVLGLSAEALSQGRKTLSDIGKNLTKSNIPQSHAIDNKLLPIISSGRMLGISSQLSRREDQVLQTTLRQSLTEFSSAEVQKRYFDGFLPFIGDPSKEAPISALVQSVSQFISRAGLLTDKNDISLKTHFVSEAKILAKTLTDATDRISSLRFDADRQIGDDIVQVNRIITEISAVNAAIVKNGRSSLDILDNRDRLVSELAQYMDLRVTYGKDGFAIVESHNGVEKLVDKNLYAQFSYNGLPSKDAMLSRTSTINPILMQHYTGDGSLLSTRPVVEGSLNSISGGTLESLIDLRDTKFVASFEAITTLAKTVKEAVNAVHNSGSSWPPKTKYQGTELVSNSMQSNWTGQSKISVVQVASGSAITSGLDTVRDLTIDFDKFSNGGLLTTQDVIKEINQINYGLSLPRLALGVIQDNAPIQIPNQYLLNNIQLVGKTDIVGGNFSFDFDIDGNQYFGSKVEILGVTGPGGALPANQLPDSFRVEKDQHLTRVGASVTVGGILPGPQNIDIKFRVIGDNGQIQEGTARFVVNQANPDMNGIRIGGIASPIPHPPGTLANTIEPGNLIPAIPGLPVTHAAIFSAKLVDDNGVEINVNDPSTNGFLVIETLDQNNAVVMDDSTSQNTKPGDSKARGFAHSFGLSNFFELDKVTGAMNVRQDIADDVNNMSTGRITHSEGVATNVKEGDITAVATMLFAGGVPNAVSTVTINGETLTFGVGLVTLQDLTDAINSPGSRASSLVTANLVGTTITLTAKKAGTAENAIQFSWNIIGGGTVDFNGVGAAANNAGTAMSNNAPGGGSVAGTDKNLAIQARSVRIGIDSTGVLVGLNALTNLSFDVGGISLIPSTKMSLQGYASVVSGVLSGQVLKAREASDIAQKVEEGINETYQDRVGISKEKQHAEAIEIGYYIQFNASFVGIARSTFDKLMEIINR